MSTNGKERILRPEEGARVCKQIANNENTDPLMMTGLSVSCMHLFKSVTVSISLKSLNNLLYNIKF